MINIDPDVQYFSAQRCQLYNLTIGLKHPKCEIAQVVTKSAKLSHGVAKCHEAIQEGEK